ncbi:UDP-glucose 6-dehydrogenase [bacterium F11]|nr:UDP-glucose 6-dehydrogenase [bacterium F11]
MKKVCVIGSGYVGLVTGSCLSEIGHRVICIDSVKSKIDALNSGEIPIYEPGLKSLVQRNRKKKRLFFTNQLGEGVRASDIVFIAVNTPPLKDGGADLSFVEACTIEAAHHTNRYKLLVEKSTVPVQTGDRIKKTLALLKVNRSKMEVASNPEFLKEGSAVHDFMNPDRLVFGVSSPKAEKILRSLYSKIKVPIVVTDINSAELIKHASNSFLALKISYINAIARICEKVGGDVEKVALGMGLDPRIGLSFLKAGIGYGGSCFPKDVSAFMKIAEKNGYHFDLLKVTQRVNQEQRDLVYKKLEEELWTVKDKKIAILGLAFKPNTDDLRNAPAVDIIGQLLKNGANINAYDPVASEKMKAIYPKIHYCSSVADTIDGVDAMVVVTEWEEVKKLDLKKARNKMKMPVVIDGRNIFDPEKMDQLGFRYYAIGRSFKSRDGRN